MGVSYFNKALKVGNLHPGMSFSAQATLNSARGMVKGAKNNREKSLHDEENSYFQDPRYHDAIEFIEDVESRINPPLVYPDRSTPVFLDDGSHACHEYETPASSKGETKLYGGNAIRE